MRKHASLARALLLGGMIGAAVILAMVAAAQAHATDRLRQTIPTPTPRTIPAPTGDASSPQATEGTGIPGRLVVRQQVNPQDVMAGQTLSIELEVINGSAEEIQGVLLSDRLDTFLRPLEVRSTQGAATVQNGVVYIDVGTLAAGQTVLAFIDARVDPEAQNGQIVLNQVTADFDGGQVVAEAAAAGLPPVELPATGRDGRAP